MKTDPDMVVKPITAALAEEAEGSETHYCPYQRMGSSLGCFNKVKAEFEQSGPLTGVELIPSAVPDPTQVIT